jgi:hypothetical protein
MRLDELHEVEQIGARRTQHVLLTPCCISQHLQQILFAWTSSKS